MTGRGVKTSPSGGPAAPLPPNFRRARDPASFFTGRFCPCGGPLPPVGGPDTCIDCRRQAELRRRETVCGFCGAVFHRRDKRARFCTDVCTRADRAQRGAAQSHAERPFSIICVSCGVRFQSLRRRFYCSPTCRERARERRRPHRDRPERRKEPKTKGS